MLRNAKVASRLPARDLNRARAFYSEKLGLDPVEQRQGGLRYVCAGGEQMIRCRQGLASIAFLWRTWRIDPAG
jgi:catechol 2,3-dioxygenase-like lactoylglutathione lyase family enzyme